ncbi:hypothetical protein SPHINGO8AM_90021 [Sphingomonas sp. 8AM]|nr:hypothetical protein SPHINGO8AM_90021 [Sphingomonas sp. 8AM]
MLPFEAPVGASGPQGSGAFPFVDLRVALVLSGTGRPSPR